MRSRGNRKTNWSPEHIALMTQRRREQAARVRAKRLAQEHPGLKPTRISMCKFCGRPIYFKTFRNGLTIPHEVGGDLWKQHRCSDYTRSAVTVSTTTATPTPKPTVLTEDQKRQLVLDERARQRAEAQQKRLDERAKQKQEVLNARNSKEDQQ
jgi:hypothetical protein